MSMFGEAGTYLIGEMSFKISDFDSVFSSGFGGVSSGDGFGSGVVVSDACDSLISVSDI